MNLVHIWRHVNKKIVCVINNTLRVIGLCHFFQDQTIDFGIHIFFGNKIKKHA